MSADYDVAIVGYGPTGAVLAALLGDSGLSVLVIEAAAVPYEKPRAMTGDHEVLRVLQAVGVADAVAAGMRAHDHVHYLGADGDPIMTVEVGPPPYPLGWPPAFHFLQPELEGLIREAVAARAGAEVRLGAILTGFEQDAEAVTLSLAPARGGEGESVRARYLMACDGAASPVRRALGIGSEDLAFDEWWIVVDAWLRRDGAVSDHAVQYCRPSRPGSFIPGPGDLRRWEIKLLPGEKPDQFQDEAELRRVLSAFVDPEAIEIWRSAVYRFHALVSDRWRQGRVFLLGDAAHQMPPFLGQGMCAGVRDAANLAWKLKLVEERGVDPALLDSYETERKPHVRAVVALAKDRGLIIGELDEDRARMRDARLRALTAAGALSTPRQKYIPGLTAGLIARDVAGRPRWCSGDLFVQPRVRAVDGRRGLMDDLVAPVFLVVSDRPDVLAGIDPAHRGPLDDVGALRVLIVPLAAAEAAVPEDVVVLVEVDGLFGGWLKAAGACAAVVRPDRYLYGAAADGADLDRLLERLARGLNPRGRPHH